MILAALNLICKGYDIGNAFTEVLAPEFSYYTKPDEQFCQWWTKCLKQEQLAKEDIPTLHAL